MIDIALVTSRRARRARRTEVRTIRTALLALVAVVLTACACAGDDDVSGPSRVPVATVSIVADAGSVLVNQSLTLTSLARSATGDSLSGRAITWQSESPWIAHVDANGMLVGNAAGVTWTSATVDGVTARVLFTVMVSAPVPALAYITPNNVVVATAPIITALSPSQITAGYPGVFTLVVRGDDFSPASQITFDGVAHETRHVSRTELLTTITPAEVAAPRGVIVAVETPGVEGGRAATTFTVNAVQVASLDIQTIRTRSSTTRRRGHPTGLASPSPAHGADSSTCGP